jgi:mRNA interferase RelE/StbE
MYSLRLLQSANRELDQLDSQIANRIVERLEWLAENLDKIKPKALTGELRGLYKIREGDYRIIYQILRKENAILVHAIGHRRDIYRKRS